VRFLPPDNLGTIYETTFSDDILGRVESGKRLSAILERIEDPLVVAIDGRWGTGKSYFLRRWVGAHRLSNGGRALTLYFDAFENDYLADPLIALVAALAHRIPKVEASKLARIKKAAMKLMRPAAKVSLALASAGGTALLNEVWDAGVEAIAGEAQSALDEFWKKEAGRHVAMQEFRSSLLALTTAETDSEPTPLIIVVDELDRCRPDFALDVLEVIKHFFAVPHVHFVLGVNLHALENSVGVRYGSEIDSTAYLQKFISFSMELPDHIGDAQRTPSIIQYAKTLAGSMGIPPKFTSEIVDQLRVISQVNTISVRDVGKLLSLVSLLPEEALKDNILEGWRIATVTLLITKVIQPSFSKKLTTGSASEEELVGYFGATREVISETLENGTRNPNYLHRTMILFYCWKYICRGGVSDGSDLWERLGHLFDSFGRPYEVKSIPTKIVEDWINVFRIS
jgi:hypothetical protein